MENKPDFLIINKTGTVKRQLRSIIETLRYYTKDTSSITLQVDCKNVWGRFYTLTYDSCKIRIFDRNDKEILVFDVYGTDIKLETKDCFDYKVCQEFLTYLTRNW